MRNILGLLLLMAMFAVGATSAAYADTVAVDQVYNFAFGIPAFGSSFAASGLNGPDSIAAPFPPWTFTLPIGGTLTVIDGFQSGDQFNVTDSGVSLGDTSVPILGANCGFNFAACLSNPDMSIGVFALGSGTHAIDGTAIAMPFGGGTAFFEVTPNVSPVPAPAALPLFATGLVALGLLGWFRKRKACGNLLGAA